MLLTAPILARIQPHVLTAPGPTVKVVKVVMDKVVKVGGVHSSCKLGMQTAQRCQDFAEFRPKALPTFRPRILFAESLISVLKQLSGLVSCAFLKSKKG